MKTTTGLIQEYKSLCDEGTLTVDEFEFLKKGLLAQGDKEFVEGTDVLQTSSQKAAKEKAEMSKSISSMVGVLIAIAIIGAIIAGCSALFSDTGSSSPEYETYYEDDNGNGKLDKGEWNYTQDENGNVVDVDNDGSNFE